MLWPVTKPANSGLYWLDTVHKRFYVELFNNSDFDDCFEAAFLPVLNRSALTKSNFQSVFDLFNDLTNPNQISFKNIFENHAEYQTYFTDTEAEILRPEAIHENLWKASKNLGKFLYEKTIGYACYKNSAPNNECMNLHFTRYKELNGEVCCFCGTEEMMEEREIEVSEGEGIQWRAAYDHYLPKAHYPFLAVDFNNLIPCCEKCNEKAKGEKDIFEWDDIRTPAFNPYRKEPSVSLIANYHSVNGADVMTVNIDDTGDLLWEKADTWNRTFLVLNRVNKRLKRFNSEWLSPLLNGIDNAETAKTALRSESIRCLNNKKEEREAYFRSLCFDEVVTKSDQHITALIEAVQQVYSGRTI
jgi:hypothetical protein